MPDISRIRLPNKEEYDVKDALLRHQINVLLGIELPDERDEDMDENIDTKEGSTPPSLVNK